MRATTGIAVVLMLALATCAGHPPETPNGPGRPESAERSEVLPPSLKTTEVGGTYVDGKVEVTAIDRSRLAEGGVRITVRNRTGERLPALEYEVTLYYPNRAEDPRHRTAMPFVPETIRRRYLDLGPNEETVLEIRPGTLSQGGVDLHLRLREPRPGATQCGDRLLRGRVEVVAVDRDWFAVPPTVSYRVRNVSGEPLRLDVKHHLIRNGEVESETGWAPAPDVMLPGGEMDLRHEFQGARVIGRLPGLQLRLADE